ncbi:MAG: rhodanese-like domain-containing protein [Candidatus Aenigmarchaeota archaeon]|nr:rhodanese-like domain-containing protein [Candidatus Aenigmarchaeota archaeon]
MLFNKDEEHRELTVEEVRSLLAKKKIVLLDVREDYERNMASIHGSIHIPVSDLKKRMNELDKKSEIVAFCHHGVRSRNAAQMLRVAGFNAKSMNGGIAEWSAKIDKKVKVYY